MRPGCIRSLWAAVAAAALAVAGPAGIPAAEPVVPPPVVFEGFGIGGFEGAGSLASALRKSDLAAAEEAAPGQLPLDIVVRGPSGREVATNPLAAEIRSRIEGLDLAAGVLADQRIVQDGPAKWTGAVGMTSVHEEGRDALEVRTAIGQGRSVGQSQQSPSITLEVGPRVERRLPGGIVLFLDGKAEAGSLGGPGTTGWSLPGLPSDVGGMVGITARTGLLR